MITPLNIFVAFLWFLSAVIDYADFCYIWQLKEYRWDRMRDFLSTEQGKAYCIRWQLLWRSLLAIVIFFWPINDDLSVKYILIALFCVDLARAFYKFYHHELKRPKMTKKAMILVFFAIFVEGILFLLTRDWTVLLLLLILRFFILSGITFALNILTNRVKAVLIKKAGLKLAQYDKLTVIGITGSYGKTTVKNYLTHILSAKFNVICTPEHTNTDIGVAQTILRSDFSNKDIFIVEIGAYRIGEIKKICDMVKPRIGILTAINEQHTSLFGDIKKTQQAKYELLLSIPKSGLAIVNCDNLYCREMLNELSATILTFGMDPECSPTLLIKESSSNLNGMSFKGEIGGKEVEAHSPIIGEFNAMNIAPCYLVALNLGMSAIEINERVSTLTGGVRIVKYGNCDIIDDSYNSNPDGFRAALDILNKFPSERHRVIITRGMLELGSKSDEIHEKIAEDIEFVADELVVITKDFIEPLKRGLDDKYRTKFVLKDNQADLLEFVTGLKLSNSVILVENRIPEMVKNKLGL